MAHIIYLIICLYNNLIYISKLDWYHNMYIPIIFRNIGTSLGILIRYKQNTSELSWIWTSLFKIDKSSVYLFMENINVAAIHNSYFECLNLYNIDKFNI